MVETWLRTASKTTTAVLCLVASYSGLVWSNYCYTVCSFPKIFQPDGTWQDPRQWTVPEQNASALLALWLGPNYHALHVPLSSWPMTVLLWFSLHLRLLKLVTSPWICILYSIVTVWRVLPYGIGLNPIWINLSISIISHFFRSITAKIIRS